jgi:hypothetical protein
MSTQWRAFRPLAATQNTASSASSQTVTFNYSLGTFAVRFCNIGTVTVFVLPSSPTVVAATVSNAIPIPAGQTEIFTMQQGTVGYTMISSGAGSTLYSTVGEGL